ncbi:hypothetical protein [Geotalea toluenoxydans]|uniref:hypothetical protein n=1 Tax=Geotalea toluenoxydans TaxID=421624 RepID=UPI0006D01352|nr:hypothetical protein [Geotalea toluenoxydans]
MPTAENTPLMNIPLQALKVHHQLMKNSHLLQLFAEDHQRGERFSMEEKGLYLDYSKNLITQKPWNFSWNLPGKEIAGKNR